MINEKGIQKMKANATVRQDHVFARQCCIKLRQKV